MTKEKIKDTRQKKVRGIRKLPWLVVLIFTYGNFAFGFINLKGIWLHPSVRLAYLALGLWQIATAFVLAFVAGRWKHNVKGEPR